MRPADHRALKRFLESYKLVESALKEDPYYKKLTGILRDVAEVPQKIKNLKRRIKVIKLSAKEDLHPNALNKFTDDERVTYDAYKHVTQTERDGVIAAMESVIEDLARQYSPELKARHDAMKKVFTMEDARLKLIDRLGSERAANYYITMYVQMLNSGVIAASGKPNLYEREFKIFPPEGSEHSVEEFNKMALEYIRNIQIAVKNPKLIKDFVQGVTEHSDFLTIYDVKYASQNRGIVAALVKKDAEAEGAEEEKPSEDLIKDLPMQDKIVFYDKNWVTYLAEPWSTSRTLKTFYRERLGNDVRFQNKREAFYPTWCITWETSTYHSGDSSQKSHRDDLWYMTFSLHNPIDLIVEHFRNNPRDLPNNFSDVESFERFISTEGMPWTKPNEASAPWNKLINMYFGEVYLKVNENGNPNHDNAKYHRYTNDPGHGVSDSSLVPAMENRYEESNTVKRDLWDVSNGILTNYRGDDEHVIVPLGIHTIGRGAFKDKATVAQVDLDYPVTKIEAGAFVNCPSLDVIDMTDHMYEIDKEAFDKDILERAIIGKLDIDEDGEITDLHKPLALRWYPDEMNSVLKSEELDLVADMIDDDLLAQIDADSDAAAAEMAGDPDSENYVEPELMESTQTEASIDFDNIDYSVRRKLYLRGTDGHYHVENGRIKFNEYAAGKYYDIILNIPEGAETMGSPMYGSYKKVVFPSTFRDIPIGLIEGTQTTLFLLNRTVELDLSRTKIKELHPKALAGGMFRIVRLPSELRVLGGTEGLGGVFSHAKVKELHMQVKNLVSPHKFCIGQEHENVFKGFNVLLDKLYTDDPDFFLMLSGRITNVNDLSHESKAAEILDLVQLPQGQEVLDGDGNINPLVKNKYLSNQHQFIADIVNEKGQDS